MNFGFIFHIRYIFVTHFLTAKYVKNDLRKLAIVHDKIKLSQRLKWKLIFTISLLRAWWQQ